MSHDNLVRTGVARWLDIGVRGVTSNAATWQDAIAAPSTGEDPLDRLPMAARRSDQSTGIGSTSCWTFFGLGMWTLPPVKGPPRASPLFVTWSAKAVA
jgi:hypothetical protein